MAINTAGDISAFINTIFEDALLVARENMFIDTLVTTFNDRMGNATRQNSQYGSATISAIGETDDLASQAFAPSSLATITPAETGGQFALTDLRMESDPFQVRSDAALELGQSMAEKIQSDVLGNFSSLTGGTVGAAGTTITWGHFFAARAQLKNQKAPEPYVAVLHEYHWQELASAAAVSATVTNAPEFQDEVQRRYYVGTAAGVDIYTTVDISVDASDDAYSAMFSRSAIALDMRRMPRLEPERDASRRLWELNMTSVYGHGVWRPLFGIQLLFDATTPTS
jgi:hypothetical protein